MIQAKILTQIHLNYYTFNACCSFSSRSQMRASSPVTYPELHSASLELLCGSVTVEFAERDEAPELACVKIISPLGSL